MNVAGECPMGCGRTLFLGEGGHVTCSFIECPNPAAADELLRNPTLLRVTEEALRERNTRLGWIEHFASGRLPAVMLDRDEVGLAIEGVASCVDRQHREHAPLLHKLQEAWSR